MTIQTPLTFFRQHIAELRHALRVVTAVIAAFVVVRLLGMPQGWWAVITAVLVVQTSVGGSLKAALDRLLGTIAGALCGAAVAVAIPHVTDLGLGIAIAAAILPLAYLAAINPMFRVAPVTALIVMLPIYGPGGNPLISAADRVIEIVIGNIVALAVTFVILPTRAHSQLREAAAKVASLNADLMDRLMDGLTNDLGRQGVPPLHAKIRAALKQAETAADEAARERKMKVSDDRDPEPVVRTLYRVRHDLVMVSRAAAKPLPEALVTDLGPLLAILRQDAVAVLRGISASLLARMPAPALDNYQAGTKALSQAIDGMAEDRKRVPHEEVARLFTLRFALDQLGEDMRDLSSRTSELAKAHSAASASPSSG
ncbi:FUSC family protein [Taklimakanibacter deserti]|uniref:FUSC family protein n=1 Tax=Taklimakanibacter deserti TaxID=2267839 RepID=UPI0013C51A8A